MAFGKKRSDSKCGAGCVTMKWVVCVLLFLTAVAALIGVYQTHVLMSGEVVRMQFGSTSGSLAIVAFTLSVCVFLKQLVKCMAPCEICEAQ